MSDKDRDNLASMAEACEKIRLFTQDITNAEQFFADWKTFDAVLMNFVVIGESVGRLSEEIRQSNNQIPWVKIKGFRNIVVHDYFGVDGEEVWQIVVGEIPKLLTKIDFLINSK